MAYALSGEKITYWDTDLSVGVNVSGGFMRFGSISKNCSWGMNLSGGEKFNNNIVCGSIIVDVNGFTKPNIMGRDIFYFAILENKILPLGTDADTFKCSITSVGRGCAAKVLTDGAINY